MAIAFIGVGGKIDFGGTGGLSRQDWVEVRPRAPKREAHGRGSAGLPQKILKIDCRKRVFQAFQALSSHFEGMGNFKETAGGDSGGPPPENFEKLIAANAFSKHFRCNAVQNTRL